MSRDALTLGRLLKLLLRHDLLGMAYKLIDDVNSEPIFDTEPEQKVQNDDHYDVFAIDCQHFEQSESVHNTYLIEQDAQNMLIESEDMNYDSEQIEQNDEDVDLAKERELFASLITKLKCEIDETKNRNTLLETSNKVLVEKLKSEIADFKNKNKSLTEVNNKLSEVSPDAVDSGPIFNKEPEQKVQNDDHYDVFAIECQQPEQSESAHNTYLVEQEAQNCLNEEMVADLRYFNSLESEVVSLISQLETQKTQFLNKIDRLSREYYYANHMNAILGVYTELD
nr:hypothetical protein [Tanacetum cinerariifolium]